MNTKTRCVLTIKEAVQLIMIKLKRPKAPFVICAFCK